MWGCAIREHDWQFPSSAPGDVCYDAQIDCGNEIVAQPAYDGGTPHALMRGSAEFADEAGFAVNVLQYGQSVAPLTVTCASTEEHVVCEDTTTGHGLIISRDENTIY